MYITSIQALEVSKLNPETDVIFVGVECSQNIHPERRNNYFTKIQQSIEKAIPGFEVVVLSVKPGTVPAIEIISKPDNQLSLKPTDNADNTPTYSIPHGVRIMIGDTLKMWDENLQEWIDVVGQETDDKVDNAIIDFSIDEFIENFNLESNKD